MANEMRLIDAIALCKDIEKCFCEPCKAKGYDYHGVACRACWVDDMRIELEDAPTVDAVPVVRCKDCKYWEDGYFGYCTKTHTAMDYDAFCSYGERREGE